MGYWDQEVCVGKQSRQVGSRLEDRDATYKAYTEVGSQGRPTECL